MVLKKKANRLGIFIFYDTDSIVDDYVLFMLDSLKEAIDDILIVSNSYLSNEEMEKLLNYTDKVDVRNNIGLDAAAFKYAYDKYGREYFNKYDEVILLNDTFYGPFEPFKKIIETMSQRDVDFWGLTANYDSEDGYGNLKYGYIPAHIQTFFIAFRKNVLESSAFFEYWNRYDVEHMLSFLDVVTKHELTFTHYLEENGFRWDTYLDLGYFKSVEREKNYNIYGYSSYNLIKNFNCPFIKRKNLVFDKNDALYLNNGMDGRNCLNYIEKNHLYPIDFILKNLVRMYDPIDIYQGLNLNYSICKIEAEMKKSLIYIVVSDCKTLQLLKEYTNQIKKHDVIIVTDSLDVSKCDERIKRVNPIDYLYKEKKNWIQKYDYVCLLNLQRNYKDEIIEIDDSNIVKTIENAIESDAYINGVIHTFEQNKYIGSFYLPASFHNEFFSNMSGYTWNHYVKLIEENGYHISAKKNKFIPHNHQGLWIRTQVLNNIEEKSFTFDELLALLPFTLKKNNQCFGKLYQMDYMANDMVCMEKMIEKMLGEKGEQVVYPADAQRVVFRETGPRKWIRRVIPKKIRSKIVNMIRR